MYHVSGVTLFEFIIGYYPVAAVVIVMQVLLMMVTIYGVYGYTCVGSYYLVFVMVFSLGICTTNLGKGNEAKNEHLKVMGIIK